MSLDGSASFGLKIIESDISSKMLFPEFIYQLSSYLRSAINHVVPGKLTVINWRAFAKSMRR